VVRFRSAPDATVLAASDPGALAATARTATYLDGAEPVLKSYVGGWYYVALRIRVKRICSRSLSHGPGVRSLDQAPERLAGHIIALTETVDAQPSSGD
jgi:hypothetical protein